MAVNFSPLQSSSFEISPFEQFHCYAISIIVSGTVRCSWVPISILNGRSINPFKSIIMITFPSQTNKEGIG